MDFCMNNKKIGFRQGLKNLTYDKMLQKGWYNVEINILKK